MRFARVALACVVMAGFPLGASARATATLDGATLYFFSDTLTLVARGGARLALAASGIPAIATHASATRAQPERDGFTRMRKPISAAAGWWVPVAASGNRPAASLSAAGISRPAGTDSG